MHAIFLNYSTKMMSERCLTFLYIPIFFVFIIGFAVILVLEFTAFWTSGNVTFDGSTNLYH